MLPCAAYLRVYEPLSAFDPAERAHWAAYAASARTGRAGQVRWQLNIAEDFAG